MAFQELENNRVKVNLRSKRTVDVSAFANAFGGGGHKMASGIVMPGHLEAVKTKIIEAFKDYLCAQ